MIPSDESDHTSAQLVKLKDLHCGTFFKSRNPHCRYLKVGNGTLEDWSPKCFPCIVSFPGGLAFPMSSEELVEPLTHSQAVSWVRETYQNPTWEAKMDAIHEVLLAKGEL